MVLRYQGEPEGGRSNVTSQGKPGTQPPYGGFRGKGDCMTAMKEFRIFVAVNGFEVSLLPLWACRAYNIDPEKFHRAKSGEVLTNIHNREDLYKAAGYFEPGVSFDWAVPMGWLNETGHKPMSHVWLYCDRYGENSFFGKPLADSTVLAGLQDQIHEVLETQCAATIK